MPTQVIDYPVGNLYDSAIIGDYDSLHVKVDVSALDATQVDQFGYLKPNVPLDLTGVQLSSAASVAQVETATAAGTIATAGTVIATVTSALLPGGSETVPVTVAVSDGASAIGGKIIAALQADANISGNFAVSGSGGTVVLTASNAAANDTTLNIALANGTATGLTAAPTSANTTAGVEGSSAQQPCITIESVKIAADNGASLATAADVLVACAVDATVNRDIVEMTLGRGLKGAEVAALKGPNSNITLTLSLNPSYVNQEFQVN